MVHKKCIRGSLVIANNVLKGVLGKKIGHLLNRVVGAIGKPQF